MSILLDKQFKLAEMISHLIREIVDRGYRVKFGNALRCEECPIGHRNSLHKQSLAVDLLIFKMIDGKAHYLTATEDYRAFGELWESMGGTWGGRFADGDGNHFSLEHDGMR